jgi:hypothetical protein
MNPGSTLDPAALAALTYRLAELLGAQAPVVRALKRAAESGDPEAGAEAWDQFLALPGPFRADVARWFAKAAETEANLAATGADPDHVVPLFGLRKPVAPR